MEEIRLEITAGAALRMLHNDALDLSQFGKLKVKRASRVEFNNRLGRWVVRSAKTGKVLRDDFRLRKDALAWEKVYYSPGQPGWRELVGQEA